MESAPLPAAGDPTGGLVRTGLLLGAAALALVWLMAGVVIWQTHRSTERENALSLAQHRRLLAEQTSAFVTAVDATLRLLAERIATGRLDPAGADAQLALRELRIQQPQIDLLSVIDAEGRVLVSSSGSGRIDPPIAGDPAFEAQASDPSGGLLIGPAYRENAGRYAFRLSRALCDDEGRFTGIVVATIDTGVLETLYAALDLDPGEGVALLDRGWRIVARYPATTTRALPPLAAAHAAPTTPAQRLVTDTGVTWVTAQRVAETPFAVVVLRDERAMLDEWHTLAQFVVAIGLLSMLPILLLTLLLLRRAAAQRRWADALEAARLRAEQASDAKSEFLAHMSHELRTPLNAVLGFADVIRHRLLPSRTEEYGESIHQAGTHLLALVNDLLDLHRIEDGRFPLACQPLDAPAALQDALALVAPLAERRRVRLADATSPAIAPCFVAADPRALRQCLFNLLGNAIKFSPEGSSVETRVEGTDDGRVRFSIRDEGAGISSEDLACIFEPFRRGSADVAAAQHGAGLGLAITKRLVELHAGGLTLASGERVGTIATVELPGGEAAPLRASHAKRAMGRG
jgi:two-component system, cell cycle sensor histidine kinase PleC